MSTLVSVLKHEITRLARKEVAAGTGVLRKAVPPRYCPTETSNRRALKAGGIP